MSRRRRAFRPFALLVLGVLSGYLSIVSPAGGADGSGPSWSVPTPRVAQELTVRSAGAGPVGDGGAVEDVGHRVPDEAGYGRSKARASAAAAERARPSAGPEPSAPGVGRDFQGVNDVDLGPSDSTGAIGTTRYVELVNRQFGIYNRTSNSPLDTGPLTELTGENNSIFDPQVMWDPTTNRFYYAADDVVSDDDNRLAFGWSKTASPNSAADFCKYVLPFGARFPDYPKLGDTSNLLVIGANSFSPDDYLGSDIIGITKPGSGSSCPAPNALTTSALFNVKDATGEDAFTPVPANQTDGDTNGYVVSAEPTFSPTGAADTLSVFTVSRNPSTNVISVGPARTLSVPAFAVPANAPQANTDQLLDTLEGRLTQAVSGIDPSKFSLALWTQHTVFGGAGAEVRWYEINPSPGVPTLLRSGKQSDGSLFNYNAAVSPDRRRNGSQGDFGSKHVLWFNTSSTTQLVDIRGSNKDAGTAGVSESVLVKDSTGPLVDFTCGSRVRDLCRWGDYSAATPDPASALTDGDGNAKSVGVVWGTNSWTDSSTPRTGTDWRTQNFSSK